MSSTEQRDIDDTESNMGDRKYKLPPYDHIILNHKFDNQILFVEKKLKKGLPQKSFQKINSIGDVNTVQKQVGGTIWYEVNAEINNKDVMYSFRKGNIASEFVDKLFELFTSLETDN